MFMNISIDFNDFMLHFTFSVHVLTVLACFNIARVDYYLD